MVHLAKGSWSKALCEGTVTLTARNRGVRSAKQSSCEVAYTRVSQGVDTGSFQLLLRALLIPIILLCFSPFLVAEAEEARTPAEALVQEKAAALTIVHQRAIRSLVTAAQDPRFGELFQDTQDKGELRAQVENIALNVQDGFEVDEMCLIDPNGAELVRITHGHAQHDLAEDETQNSFFHPSMEKQHRQAFVAPIYMSADAKKWVVAYTTPIVVEGKKYGILHYEKGLEFYQRILSLGLSGSDRFLLVVDKDGHLLSDSRSTIPVEQVAESEDLNDYFDEFRLNELTLSELLNGLVTDGDFEGDVIIGDDGHFSVAHKQVEDWHLLAFIRNG